MQRNAAKLEKLGPILSPEGLPIEGISGFMPNTEEFNEGKRCFNDLERVHNKEIGCLWMGGSPHGNHTDNIF